LNYYGDDIRFATIVASYSSVADTAIIPMQDVLNLGSEARMNFPGRLGGNWTWRFEWQQLNDDLTQLYKELTILYER
jgi:4-alpha-glucanotransferase